MHSESPPRILHVLPRIHKTSSGPTYSVTRLCAAQANLGANVELHVTHSQGQRGDGYTINPHGSTLLSGKLLCSPSLRQLLSERNTNPRIIHNHSLWMLPNVYPRLIPFKDHLVVSPRGTFSDWAWNRSYKKKRLIWHLGQKRMLDRCQCFHATAEHERLDIRKRGFKQPVAVIPNGIDLPDQFKTQPTSGPKTLLFLARLHPVKGLEHLLASWAKLQCKMTDWKLVIAGDGKPSYTAHLKQLASSLHLKRIDFVGSVYGEVKNRLFINSDLYVLPSHTENFGVSIAEAMAHGIPVITTNATPWLDLQKRNAGWCIELGEAPLTTCLQSAMNCPPETLSTMGARARAWMQSDFSWQEVAKKTLQTYDWLAGEIDRPDWICN